VKGGKGDHRCTPENIMGNNYGEIIILLRLLYQEDEGAATDGFANGYDGYFICWNYRIGIGYFIL
jgi:hypothetical protein